MHNTPRNYTERNDYKYTNEPLYRAMLQYQGQASESLQWLIDHQDTSGYSVLDYGCGPGRNTLALTLKGVSVEVYDPSSIALSDLLSNIERYKIDGDLLTIQKTPTFTKKYDVIILCCVVHFISSPAEAKELIHSLLKNIKSGGYFCFEYFTPEIPWYRPDDYYPVHSEILYEFFDPGSWTECFFEQKDDGDGTSKKIREMCVFQKK